MFKNLTKIHEVLRNKQKLEKLYYSSGSMKEVAIKLGCGETVVHKWIHKLGIKPKLRIMTIKGHKKSLKHRQKLSISAKKRVGELNPNWKGGKISENRKLRGRSYRERRTLVLERDNYECQKCGVDLRLHIHHIKPIKDYPELVNDISNCITLCRKCHYDLHFSGKNLANSVKPLPIFRVGNAEPSTWSVTNWNPNWMSTPTDLGACVETIYEKPMRL